MTTAMMRGAYSGSSTAMMRRAHSSTPAMRRVALQLDYHMSPQFAGLAVALQRGLFPAAGLDLSVLPTCPPGEEPARVFSAYSEAQEQLTVLGSIEQNVLLPHLRSASAVPVSAVAAMYATSPLALAALPGTSLAADGLRIGAHVDTVELLQRIVPHANVLAVSREDKLQLLRRGEIDAVQVYDCMETLRLRDDLGVEPEVRKLEQLTPQGRGAWPDLGYSQVLFAPDEALRCPDQREDVRKTCAVLFAGWAEAIRDPEAAARDVAALVPRGKLGELDGAAHWSNSPEFLLRSVEKCCEYVKQTRRGSMLGTIDPARWAAANDWLHGSDDANDDSSSNAVMGLDQGGAYSLDPRCMAGHDVAAALSKKIRAEAFALRSALGGRRPSLLVVSVGSDALGAGHDEADARLQKLSAPSSSWYSKALTSEVHGVDTCELRLPAETTTEQLLHTLRSVRLAGGGGFDGSTAGIFDGVQLMWPLPEHIDAQRAFAAIPSEVDVDGAHWIGDVQLASRRRSTPDTDASAALVDAAAKAHGMPPVTPAAVLELLSQNGVCVQGTETLIVGRSRIVGQPLACALGDAGATVTLAHSATPTENLKAAVGRADIVISCVGQPGLIEAAWLQKGATAISVGSALSEETGNVASDIAGLAESETAGRYASVPGGVGPIAVMKLLENVLVAARGGAERAARRAVGTTADTPAATAEELGVALECGWDHTHGGGGDGDHRPLVRRFWLPSYTCALSFVESISEQQEAMNHHADTLSVDHKCVRGVEVAIELATLSSGGAVTEADCKLAAAIAAVYDARQQVLAVEPPSSSHN